MTQRTRLHERLQICVSLQAAAAAAGEQGEDALVVQMLCCKRVVLMVYRTHHTVRVGLRYKGVFKALLMGDC